jgi:general secretion pathway protein F
MTNFRYKALTQSGEIVTGSIAAPSAAEVASRIEYLGLVLIEAASETAATAKAKSGFSVFSRPSAEDVTVFTRDLALLLKAGARINDALDLLATDVDVGRLRPVVARIKAAILSGETFADAISQYPTLFPAIYVALVRVGETSGTIDHILQVLSEERTRAEQLRRKLTDALRYPAFVLFGSGAVLLFFLFFVLPQFGSVLRDLGAKLDPMVAAMLDLSDFARTNTAAIIVGAVIALLAGWLAWRQPGVRNALIGAVAQLPLVHTALSFHRAGLFCRNLSVLLASGVTLTATLRVLNEMMAATGSTAAWTKAADRVRHGSKLSEAIAETETLPPMAVRMLRLGEETGQLPMLAGRVADFYEAKLQRSLDRVVAVIGPFAIIFISTVVGGLIVSVMTALLSVSQIAD